MALSAISMSAQDKKFAVGVDVKYGLASDYKPFGFGAKFQWEFVENLRAELSGDYFLKKNEINVWDGNLNFHYLIPLGESVKIYPIAGVTILGYKSNVGNINISIPGYNGTVEDYLRQYGLTWEDLARYGYTDGYTGGSSVKETKFGFNAGAGVEFYLSESFKLSLEAKYQYTKINKWPVIGVGAAYCF